ncbi:MAG: M28 family peptidase, partial [Gemmatimonadota bacterium]|nr:M28 family peptidase [Gemmatimonadota bacterium]
MYIAFRRLFAALGALALAACSAARPGAPAAVPVEGALDVRGGLERDAELVRVLEQVSAARIGAYDSTLVSFGTRHTMSDTLSATRGIGAARRWLHQTLSGFAEECDDCLRVEYDTATVLVTRHPDTPSVRLANVIAWLPGRDLERVVVIGAHYDSCICADDPWDATSDAPGADDDGSGTSAVLEVARVLSRSYPDGMDATVLFALYAGEEQGLLGSTALARRLHDEGYDVAAAMTDDIVGNVSTGGGRTDSTSVRIFAADPDNGASRELARHTLAVGAVYLPDFEVLPVWRLDRIGRGGDHIPFQRLGDPAMRFSERLEHYGRQHLPTDTLGGVNFVYVAQVARLNAAVVASIALAPPPPDTVRASRD